MTEGDLAVSLSPPQQRRERESARRDFRIERSFRAAFESRNAECRAKLAIGLMLTILLARENIARKTRRRLAPAPIRPFHRREGNRQEGTREGGMHVAAKGQKSRGTRAPAVRNVQLDLEITPSRMHPRSSFLVRNEASAGEDVKRRCTLAILPVESLVKFKQGSALTSSREITRHCFLSARRVINNISRYLVAS